MKYSREQLMDMPMSILRNVDIQNADEERIVQDVLNTRLKDMPVGVSMSFPASVTDGIKTVEDEMRLQKIMDDRRMKLKAHVIGATTPEEEEEEAPSPEEEDMEAPTSPAADVTPVEEPLVPPSTEPLPEPSEVVGKTEVKFCDYCDSKGVSHKKVCTRPRL